MNAASCLCASHVLTIVIVSSNTGNLDKYAAVPPSRVASLDFDCSSVDDTVYTTSYQETFDISCENSVSSDVDGTYSGAIVTYTLDDCIEACSSLN